MSLLGFAGKSQGVGISAPSSWRAWLIDVIDGPSI